jgi:cell division protein FtsB
MNLRRLFVMLYLALFAGVGVMAALYFEDTREEYARYKAVEARDRQRLDEAERRLHRQEEVLQRLRTDPAFVEQQIRRSLGYAKPDEMIFRFEE